MGHMVSHGIYNRLYFGTIVQYDAEATMRLISFDNGDTDKNDYVKICVAEQLFKDNATNKNSGDPSDGDNTE